MRQNKQKAIRLRLKGLSYNQISKIINVPKSTLSSWFRNLEVSKAVKKSNIEKAKQIWAKNITVFNKRRSQLCRAQWLQNQNEAKKDIGRISIRELKLIGSALYWAEGYKKGNWNLVFCNSDPDMLALMMEFFLKVCHVPIGKIKAQIQLHPRIIARVATKYWSKVIGLPVRQFSKPMLQISKSSKLKRGNTLPYGTLRIKINDVKLVNKIKGWIEGLSQKIKI